MNRSRRCDDASRSGNDAPPRTDPPLTLEFSLTLHIEQKNEPLPDVAKTIHAVAIELQSIGEASDPQDGNGARLQVLSEGLRAMSVAFAETIAADTARHLGMRDALAASEREFRSIAENLPDNIARWDCLGNYLYINPTHERTVCRPAAEVIGTRVSESYDRVSAAIARVVATGEALPCVRQTVRDEMGDVRVHEVSLIPEKDADGRIVSVLGIGRDVTRQVQTEQDLKHALDFAEGIIAAIPDTLLELDRDGRYLNVWAKNPDMLATPANAIIGRTVGEVLSAPQAASAMQAIREADRRGVAYGHMILVDLPDGSHRWFEHSLAKKPGETPANDTFLMLSRDVTARTQAEQALDTARARLLSVLQTIPDMVWLKDVDGVFLLCNHGVERFAGRPASEIVGRTDYDFFDVELADFFREKDVAAMEARHICINEERVTWPDTGESVLFETRKVPVFDADGKVTGVLGVARDITERKNIEEMLASREQEFRTLVEHSPDMIVRYDRNLQRVYTNPLFAAFVEGGLTSLIGGSPSGRPVGSNGNIFEQKLREVFASGKVVEFEHVWQHGSGTQYCHWVKLTPEPGPHGAVETILAMGRDVTELRASREKIHRLAYYDPLTSLPNRALFNERLRLTFADAAARGALAGVMMIDMDRFKDVNDTMGHAVGDDLLCEAARRLSASVRPCDTVARFGGDEFAVLLPDICDRSILEDISRTILSRFDERFVLNGREVYVTCSIGIALYPADSIDVDDLMQYADLAMYLAKRSGRRGFCFYSKELTADAIAHLRLGGELRGAVGRGEFELHYQPKVSLRDNEVIGSEALLRWERPGVGLVPPNQFIPIAEETGLIADLGEWVLREACRTAVEWNTGGAALHKVAVNLSARQFQFGSLASMVEEILDETGCRPEWLELEITESLLLEEDGSVLGTLSAFKSMGLSIAIDDFGTGYSALSYLARFPIDTLKIDRSFVQKAAVDRRHAELVKAILSIARCLGQQVVAEGVETAEQAAFLRESGCEVAQGFLFSKPLAKQDMSQLPHYLDLSVAKDKPGAVAGRHEGSL